MSGIGLSPIDWNLTCTRCRYSLRGLSAGAVCPECGTPAAVSLDPTRLANCPRDFLSSLVQATTLQLWLIPISIVAAAVTWELPEVSGPVSILTGGFGVLSIWFLTAPDPRAGTRNAPDGWLRGLATAGLGPQVLGRATGSLGMRGDLAINLATGLVMVAIVFLLFRRYRSLALRVPDPGLSRLAWAIMWGMSACYGLILFGSLIAAAAMPDPGSVHTSLALRAVVGIILTGGAGIVIFWLLALVLVVRMRGAFKRAHAAALERAAAAAA